MPVIENPSTQTHPAPWLRLYRGGIAVGFMRDEGRAAFYSKDGYGWSGRAIEYDACTPQTDLRDAQGKRIFEGDLVFTRIHRQTGAMGLRVVLLDPQGRAFLIDPTRGTIQPPEEIWLPPKRPQIAAVERSMFEDPTLMAAALPFKEQLNHHGQATLSEAVAIGGALALGIGLAGALQWMVIGEVGPIISMFGGLFAALQMVKFSTQRNPFWLERKRMLKLAIRSGLVLGGILAVVYAGLIVFGVNGLASDDDSLIIPIGGIGLLGTLAGTILLVIAADLKAWRSDGYRGEDES